MARKYKRDANGKFTSGGTKSSTAAKSEKRSKRAKTARTVAKKAAITAGVAGISVAAAVLGDKKLTKDSRARREAFHVKAAQRSSKYS